MADRPTPPYRVDRLSQVTAQVRFLADKANRLGLGGVYVAALKQILEKLQTEPLAWADPEYHTIHEGGTVCHAIQSPLLVRYVVYEPERVVCILALVALPGHPLGQSEE
jgi:hypothetical protein